MTAKSLPVRAVIWDFDGPIVDSLTPGLRIVEAIAARRNLPFTEEIKLSLVRKWGLKGSDLIRECFGIPQAASEIFYREWSDHPDNTRSFVNVGVRRTLQTFKEAGIVNSILTSRPSWSLEPALKVKRLRPLFDRIVTTCDTRHHKPDPLAFACTLQFLAERGITRDECVFIGDTYVDIAAGRDGLIRTFIVRTGPYAFFEPEDFDPAHILPSAAHLPERLKHLGLLE